MIMDINQNHENPIILELFNQHDIENSKGCKGNFCGAIINYGWVCYLRSTKEWDGFDLLKYIRGYDKEHSRNIGLIVKPVEQGELYNHIQYLSGYTDYLEQTDFATLLDCYIESDPYVSIYNFKVFKIFDDQREIDHLLNVINRIRTLENL